MASSTANAPGIVDDDFDASGTEIIARDNNISSNPPYEDTDATELPLGNVAKDYEEQRSSSSSNKEGGFFKKNKRMVLKIGAGALAGALVLCAAVSVTGNNNSSSMVRSQFNKAMSKTPKSSKAPKPSIEDLLARIEALESALADVVAAAACVTYDSVADVCTIGNVTSTNVIADDFVYVGTGENDLTTGNGIKISDAGDTELTLNTGNFIADVAQNIDLEAGKGRTGGTAFMGTGPSDQTSGSGIRFVKSNGNALLTLNSGNFIADVAQDIDLEAGKGGGGGSKAFLGTGPIDQTSGSGIRFNKGNGNALLTLNSGNFIADVAQDIDLEAGKGGGGGSKAFLGTGPIDQTSGSGIRFNKGNGNALLTLNSGNFIADVAQDIDLEAGKGGGAGSKAFLGTGPIDQASGSGIRFNKGDGNALLTLNSGNFIADVAQDIDLEAGKGGGAGSKAFLGTGPIDQASGSGIRFNKGDGNAFLTLNSGNFIADVAQDIDLEAGKGGGGGSKAFLGTGPIDQTSGSGIRFNKGNGNALLTLNSGNFIADVAQDIDLEAGTGGGDGSKAFLGTGPIDQTSGSGIRFNKGNGNAFLTTNTPGQVFIESGANGYLTGTCGATQANVCA